MIEQYKLEQRNWQISWLAFKEILSKRTKNL